MSVKETLSGRASQRAEAGALGLAGAHFLGAFLLSAGQIGSVLAPFGVAASAASPPGLRRAAALAGACLGYLVTGPLEWGIRYAAACVFVFTLLFIFQDARWARAPWVSPLLAALVTAATGALGCAASGEAFADALPGAAAEAALSSFSVCFSLILVMWPTPS